MQAARYLQPETLDEALQALAHAPMRVAAGCTDLFAATPDRVLSGDVLDLTRIASLRGITANETGWRIGAVTTWNDVLAADLPPAFDMLKQAAREVGSVQIQNTATVAGNLCNASPAADGVPPLLALAARVELRSAAGTRSLPLDRFITGVRQTALRPGELVSAIHVPRDAGLGHSRFLKLGARRYLVISIVMVALRIAVRAGRVGEAAVAVGSCSPVARRLPDLETRLIGRAVDDLARAVTDSAVLPALSPITDIRADADYRAAAAVELLRRGLAGFAAENESEAR